MRAIAALALILAATSPSMADDERNQRRQNLVDLSLNPDEFVGQTKRVFCPIETAQIDHVVCYVLNERLQTVGVEFLWIEGISPQEFSPILNRCVGSTGRNVGDDCAFEVDVYVKGPKGSSRIFAKKFHAIR